MGRGSAQILKSHKLHEKSSKSYNYAGAAYIHLWFGKHVEPDRDECRFTNYHENGVFVPNAIRTHAPWGHVDNVEELSMGKIMSTICDCGCP